MYLREDPDMLEWLMGKTSSQLEARREKLTERLTAERAGLAEKEREVTAALVEDRPARAKASDVEASRARAAALQRAVGELGPAIDAALAREREQERLKLEKEARRVQATLADHAQRVDAALRQLEGEWSTFKGVERMARDRARAAGLATPPARPRSDVATRAFYASAPYLAADLELPRRFAHHGEALARYAGRLVPPPAGAEAEEDDPFELKEEAAT